VKEVQENEAPSLGPNWQQHNLAKLHASTHDLHITKLIQIFFNMPLSQAKNTSNLLLENISPIAWLCIPRK
jgi:hypothetical protein